MNYSELLNDKQLEAVKCTKGPLLIIAGAGSGKTRVLTYRIAYLMQEKHVSPWNIMAITFTNKAAQEMRDRVNDIAGFGAEAVWVSTFHSSCARILRRYIERIGYTNSFSIYDTDDTKQVLKNIISDMNVDIKRYPPKKMQYIISSEKNAMRTAQDMLQEAGSREEEIIADIFVKYEETLFKNNALDFDDLLIKTVELFEKEPDVLNAYQERFKYILVDEYQDTNGIQFKLIDLLSQKYRNLCVVGDDDQSIYKFRGADIRNILDFEKKYKEAKVIKLEQNYRSTGNILNGANGVICNNKDRKEKTLWTSRDAGALIEKHCYPTAVDEAKGVTEDIVKRSACEPYNSFAILYRTNAQSRLFEEQMIMHNIPYRLVGGTNFYSRKEIKDILAYLKTIENGRDDVAVKRIINVPKRGIGDRSIQRISDHAVENDMTFFEALCDSENVAGLGKTAAKAGNFTLFIKKYRSFSSEMTVSELIKKLIDETGYVEQLKSEGTEEALDRISNIDELISKAETYNEEAEDPTLSGFLQEVSLVADIDSLDSNDDRVFLMTVHSSKGLEFNNVFLVGMEEGLFPGFSLMFDADEEELQEERRLFYVGMTRAKNTLSVTSAQQRMVRGEYEYHKTSMFVEEIPPECIHDSSRWEPKKTRSFFDDYQETDFMRSTAVKSAPKKIPYGKTFDAAQFKLKKADKLEYTTGDRVNHRKFGEGRVIEIKDGAKDYEVTVDFDKCGTKRMFAAFAKLEKI